jgi:hypothetical protein
MEIKRTDQFVWFVLLLLGAYVLIGVPVWVSVVLGTHIDSGALYAPVVKLISWLRS